MKKKMSCWNQLWVCGLSINIEHIHNRTTYRKENEMQWWMYFGGGFCKTRKSTYRHLRPNNLVLEPSRLLILHF